MLAGRQVDAMNRGDACGPERLRSSIPVWSVLLRSVLVLTATAFAVVATGEPGDDALIEARQQVEDGGLAGPHGADKEYVVCHCIVSGYGQIPGGYIAQWCSGLDGNYARTWITSPSSYPYSKARSTCSVGAIDRITRRGIQGQTC